MYSALGKGMLTEKKNNKVQFETVFFFFLFNASSNQVKVILK